MVRVNYDHPITSTLLGHIGIGCQKNLLWDDTATTNYNAEQAIGLKGATINRNFPTSRGVGLPYSSFPANQTVLQSLLPFPQYSGNLSPASALLGKTWYDSLQTTVTQRFAHGLSLNANFTWSKNLDLMSSPDTSIAS